jgi:hypothetical protein
MAEPNRRRRRIKPVAPFAAETSTCPLHETTPCLKIVERCSGPAGCKPAMHPMIPNFLAISRAFPHISAIVTGAWTFSGSAGARTLVTDFSSYPLR